MEAEGILNQLHRSKLLLKVCLKYAYLQILLDQSSSVLMTINTHFDLLKYGFLPFCLSCSLSIFQEVMDEVVSDLKGVEVYQNDINVYGYDKVIHNQRLIALLSRLVEKNMYQ